MDGATPHAPVAAEVLHDPDRRWVIAYGSNANPARLVEKSLDHRGCLLLPASVWGWVTAWEARRSTHHAAVPLTIVRRPGARLDTWVLGVHHDDLTSLDAGEFRGRNYRLGAVGDVAVASRWHLRRALAYGPAERTEVLLEEGGGPLTHLRAAQDRAAAALDGGSPRGRAEPLPGHVEGAWPATPLGDLDLFVYGTLMPGEERWSAVADLAEVVGPASARGTLYATPMGWPAFVTGAGGQVHGVLLRARAEDAAELYSRCDRVEGEGDLFQRTAARITGPKGEVWAAVYVWHPSRGEPPGRVLGDGRWR